MEAQIFLHNSDETRLEARDVDGLCKQSCITHTVIARLGILDNDLPVVMGKCIFKMIASGCSVIVVEPADSFAMLMGVDGECQVALRPKVKLAWWKFIQRMMPDADETPPQYRSIHDF